MTDIRSIRTNRGRQGLPGPPGVIQPAPANSLVGNPTNAVAIPVTVPMADLPLSAATLAALAGKSNSDHTHPFGDSANTFCQGNDSRLSSVLYLEPTGGDDTVALRNAFAVALADSKILYLSGSFTVTGELLPQPTWNTGNSLKVYGLGDTKITANATGSSFEAVIVLETNGINVIELDNIKIVGNDKIRTGVWFRHYSAGGYVKIFGCDISGCLNAIANETNSGIVILGKYQTVEITAKVTNCRNTSTAVGAAVAGITVAGYVGTCRIDGDIENITTSLDRDADGIKVFGDQTIAEGLYRPQTCLITGRVKNCTGRLIKVQTSDVTVRDIILEQTAPNVAQGVGISLQWGGGLLENCLFKLGAELGDGYAPIFIDNRIEDQKTKTVISNIRLQCSEPIPRIVVISESADTLDSEYVIDGVSAEINSGGVCSRAIVEWNYYSKPTKTVFRVSNLLVPTDSPIIGYTGYLGTGDLSGKLFVEVSDCRNSRPVLNINVPFYNISGDPIKEFSFRYRGLDGINTIIAGGLHINFNEIAVGAIFGFYLDSGNITFENGPVGLADGTYLVESLVQWFPSTLNVVRLTNLSTGLVKLKFGSNWV